MLCASRVRNCFSFSTPHHHLPAVAMALPRAAGPHLQLRHTAGRSPARALSWSRCKRVVCKAVLQEDPPKSPQGPVGAPLGSSDDSTHLPELRQYLEQLVQLEELPPRPVEEEDPSSVWHFAYGANMCYETMARRGCKVLSRDAAVVVDPDYKMVFRHRGGYATLSKQDTPGRFPGFRSHVHGVLFKLPKEDMKKLCSREGGYVLKDIEVDTYNGRRVLAKAFVSGPMSLLPEEVRPTERYMRLLREGAGDNYLDPLYQAWLSSVETVPSAGLGPEYYDTPAKYLAYCFLGVVALLVAGFFAQHV